MKDFSIIQSEDFSAGIDIPKPKILKKMPPGMKKRILADYNSKVEAAKKAAKEKATGKTVLNSSSMLLKAAFDLNEQYSYEYLFNFVTEKKISPFEFHECLNKRKHPKIFSKILNYCLENGYFEESKGLGIEFDGKFFSLKSYLEENGFKIKELVPTIDLKSFYSSFHSFCLSKPGIQVNTLHLYSKIELFDKYFSTIEEKYKTDFIISALSAASQTISNEGYLMLIKKIIDIISLYNIELPLNSNSMVATEFSNNFKKLVFEREFEYVLKFQGILKKNLEILYQKLTTKLEKDSKMQKSEDEEDDNDGTESPITTRSELKDTLSSILISTTLFESYNQIDFNENP